MKYGAWWEDEYADLIKHEQLVEHEIKKVIFLDIDGVLNDEGLRYDEGHIIDNQFVLNLRRIIDKTGAEIVLTSSWRYSVRRYLHDNVENSSVKILFDFFDRYKMKIVGCTLEYNISGPYSRPLEIRSWLQKDLRLKILSYLMMINGNGIGWSHLLYVLKILKEKVYTGNSCRRPLIL